MKTDAYVGRTRRGLLVLALLASAGPAAALDPGRLVTQYLSENWQLEQGLPQNGAGALARTPDGYLWVATQEGLARFDGIGFTVFDRANTEALRHSMIHALRVDRAGRLWIGTRRGLACLENGSFTAYGPESGLPDDRISSLLEDRAGTLWVGTLGRGLYRRAGARFEPFDQPGLPGKRIRALLHDRSGDVWVATEAGLGRVTAKGVANLTVRDGLADDNGFELLEDRDGSVWFGAEGGLSRLRPNANTWERFTVRDGLSSNRIRVMTQDAEGSVWIGTEDGGLTRLAGGRFATLNTHNGFPQDSIGALLVDFEGNLWVGTNGAGLVRLSDGPLVTFGAREGVGADVVSTVTEGRDGTLWLGTFGAGIARLEEGTRGGLRAVRRKSLTNDRIASVVEDAAGQLWVGTYGEGLQRLRDGHLRRVAGLASDSVGALLPARDGSVWIGMEGGGLVHAAGDHLTTYTEKDGLPDNYVQALYEDRSGSLWIGSPHGVARLREGKIEAWTLANGLPAPSILSFMEAPNGDLWMGTAGDGLVRFKGGRFAQLTIRQGLPNDGAFAMLLDDSGQAWISSNRGLYRTTPEALEAAVEGRGPLQPIVYGVDDGMRSAEGYGGSQPSGWKSRDGRLWFAGIRGLVMADPRWQPPVAPHPPVLVETVREARGSHRGNAPVRLAAGARSVEIQYTALGLRAPRRLRFRYQLEGYDTEWVEAGSRRTAYYPRLPGGQYVFRVASIDADGRLGNEARLALTVEPAWHERGAVRVLLAGLVALAGFGLHQVRTWRLRVRQVELQTQVAEQTIALRQANQELERLAAVDGLTGIPNRRTLDEALAREWQDHRRRGSSLAVILCDIDHFKAYNDTCGHPAGDATLRRIAQVLASQCRRATDLAARYGGEEFALLLPDTTVAAAMALAEQLLAAVRALALPHPASSAADHVTLSLGVSALVPGPETTTADLLRHADESLYRAKHAGRNRAVAATPTAG